MINRTAILGGPVMPNLQTSLSQTSQTSISGISGYPNLWISLWINLWKTYQNLWKTIQNQKKVFLYIGKLAIKVCYYIGVRVTIFDTLATLG